MGGIEKAVILPESMPVEVRLSADSEGIVSLGIRINGSNWCILSKGVTLPEADRSNIWSKNIGEMI
jgi:hypothetical protein